MSDFIQTGLRKIEDIRLEKFTHDVSYLRGSSSYTVRATVGASRFTVADAQGFETTLETRDYIISLAEFELAGLPMDGFANQPELNDQIQDTVNGQACLFTVLQPGLEKWWIWHDQLHLSMRIHTKAVGT